MTSEERTSIENGLWLCQNCAKLVDNDTGKYTAGLLEQWKAIAESIALLEVESQGCRLPEPADIELLRFFTQCLDRPAFQDPFRQEGSMEAFDRALEDTITALDTGCLRNREGQILAQGKGKAFLRRHEWRRAMDSIVDMLRALRSRYLRALKSGQIQVHDNGKSQFYIIRNHDVAKWMDDTRAELITAFSELTTQAGLPGLTFPRQSWQGSW